MLETLGDFGQNLSPDIVYLVLMIGFWALITALYAPGLGVPEAVAGISLVVTIPALFLLPVSFVGLGLILSALVALLALLYYRHEWWLVGVGGALLLAGSLLLFRAGSRVNGIAALSITVAGILYFRLILSPGLTIQDKKHLLGGEGLLGQHGRVVSAVDTVGTVHLLGEVWQATSEQAIESGQYVRVVGQKGLKLQVEPVDGPLL